MIYLDWSPALKFFVRCGLHDELETASFESVGDARLAMQRHRADCDCRVLVDKRGWCRSDIIQDARMDGKLPDMSKKTVGYKAMDYR